MYRLLKTETNDEKAKKMMNIMSEYEMLREEDKIKLNYYETVSEDKILKLFESGKLTEEELFEIGKQKNISNKLIEFGKAKTFSKIKATNYMKFLPKTEIIKMVAFGEIPYDFLIYANLSKDDIFQIVQDHLNNRDKSEIGENFEDQYNNLLQMLVKGRDKLPKNLQISSKELLEQYGKTINGTMLESLVYDGCIDSADVINIMSINQVLKLICENEFDIFPDEKVLEYYSDEKLTDMFLFDEMDELFVNRYKKILGENFEEKSKNVFKNVNSRIINNSEMLLLFCRN